VAARLKKTSRALTRAVLGVVVAALAPALASADATPAPNASAAPGPLRHLSYAVNVGIRSSDSSMNFGGGASQGGGSMAKGTIDADVIGLAPANTLVFRVSENTDTRKAPPVTVTVLELGQTRSNLKDADSLNEEELALLGMLGRGVVANHDLADGATWKVVSGDPKNSDTTTYTVASLVGESQANVNFERSIKGAGATPYDIAVHGKMLYDYKRSIPLSATITQRVHQEGTTQTTIDMSFDYTLVADSMAK
jgi:hypothetical protein